MTIVQVVPATTNHPGDAETWNDSKLWDPGLFKEEGAEIVFGIGAYTAHQRIPVGDHVTVRGATPIPLPTDRLTQVTMDPAKMAVLTCIPKSPNPNKKGGVETAGFRLEKSVGTTLTDLYLLGYQGIDFLATQNATAERVVVQHYVGDWPNGYYCWFQQTGAFFVHGGSNGTKLIDCSGISQHHTFLNHDGGWIKNSLWDGCRSFYAGCGKEADGTGYRDWTVGGDGGEECDIDGLVIRNGTFIGAGKCGIYFEPEVTGTKTGNRTTPFVRKNVLIEGNLCGQNGRYGGGILGQMRIKEGEQAGIFAGSGTIRGNTLWDNAKANIYSRQEYNVDPLVVEGNVCVGSNVGILLELGGAAGTFRDNVVWKPKKYGFKMMGKGAVIGTGNEVTVEGGAEAYHLGGYTRVYLQDSREAGHQALVKSTSAETFWGMSNLSLSGRVQSPGPLYAVHPGTTVQTSRIALTRAENLTAPVLPGAVPDEKPPVVDEPVPEVVLPPKPEPFILCEDGALKNVMTDGRVLMQVGGFMQPDAAAEFPHGTIWRRVVE
ncbi:MAG: right-handed parallel beta-helix repeat-containing protein [Candidatus Neomarinimicrobiota bacterium]